jgi:hypothetical protein
VDVLMAPDFGPNDVVVETLDCGALFVELAEVVEEF